MNIVEVDGLRKSYGDTHALSGLDLEVESGTVLGVLGPNGAGKTTAVRVLATLIRPDSGRAIVDGIDVVAHPAEARRRIGLTGQYAAVDERLTGSENIELIARFFGMPATEARSTSHRLLERFDLADAGQRVVGGYSGGMRRRLDIAMSLVGNPAVLFLDEPTTGLDPRSRQAMWELIEELVADGMSTFLTTQYLDEADRLADRIVVIDEGRAIATGTASELKDRVGGAVLTVTLTDTDNRTATIDALAHLRPDAGTCRGEGTELAVQVRAATTTVDAVMALDRAGLTPVDCSIQRPTLDDVFMTLTGHAAERDEDEAGDTK